MEVQGQCYDSKRTDNHVKRVSCRRSSSKLHHLSVIIVLSYVWVQVTEGADISCQGIRYTYANKGLDTSDIPVAPQQGEFTKFEGIAPSDVSILKATSQHVTCQS